MKTLETLKFIGRIRSNKNRQRGFTLIELVVVLAVLGILAAIGIPQLTGLQGQAERAGAATNIASEIGNSFARDLAAGIGPDNTGDVTNVDWSSDTLCAEIRSNKSTTSATLDESDFFLVSDSDADDGDPKISVPTYDGEITNDSVSCFVSESDPN